METTGRVQDCGCIALAPEVQNQTGLYPGTTFRIEVTPEKQVVLIPLETNSSAELKSGATCGQYIASTIHRGSA
jgi:hypothetical protein